MYIYIYIYNKADNKARTKTTHYNNFYDNTKINSPISLFLTTNLHFFLLNMKEKHFPFPKAILVQVYLILCVLWETIKITNP